MSVKVGPQNAAAALRRAKDAVDDEAVKLVGVAPMRGGRAGVRKRLSDGGAFDRERVKASGHDNGGWNLVV